MTSPNNERRPFPNVNGIRDFVINELQRRKLSEPMPIAAPFIRFTSCQEDKENNYKFFSLGLHGYDGDATENIFDQTYGANAADVVGYGFEVRKNGKNLGRRLIHTDEISVAGLGGEFTKKISPELQTKFMQEQKNSKDLVNTQFAKGAHPIPGITGATIDRGWLVPTKSTVSWTCYNRAQLEFIRNHFLIAGNYVVLEWGQQFSDKKLAKTLDFSDPNILDELVACLDQGRRRIITKWIEPNNGNYEFLIGRVGNFTVNFDSRLNLFRCTTDIMCIGEVAWGLSIHRTLVKKKTINTEMNSMADYFLYGRGFDQLVASLSGDPKMVARANSVQDKNNQNTGGANDYFKNFSSDPHDNFYISWECFSKHVIPNMLALLDDVNVQNDLKKYTDLTPTEGTTEQEEDWVGANLSLRSTDPTTLILIGTKILDKAGGFVGAGAYDAFGQQGRGKLSKGVWLNAGAIRQSFLGATEFYWGLQQLLTRINNATEQYWRLEIFYDEELNRIKVVDVNCISNHVPRIFMFNKDNKGELLNVELNSAFPPEIINQVMNYNNFRTLDIETKQELLDLLPSISNPSTFVFSLNWSGLSDALSRRINDIGGGVIPASANLSRPDSVKHDDRISNRIATADKQTSAKVGASTQGHAPGAKIGAPVVNAGPSMTTRTSGKVVDVKIPKDPTGKAGARGTIAYRHNNPGNLEYAHQPGATQGEPKLGGGYWARFETQEDGLNALCRDIDIKKEKNLSLRQFVYVYAPPTQNNSEQYLQQVATQLQAKDTDNITQFDTLILAKVVAQKESGTSITGPGIAALANKPPTPLPKVPSAPVTLASTPMTTVNGTIPPETGESKKRTDEIHQKFGTQFDALIETSPSAMVSAITHDGYQSYPNPNAFVWGFPTTTKVSLQLQGVAGFSLMDGFVVDKMPFIYERHGIFTVNKITESIGAQGWISKIDGIYKLIWLGKDGDSSIPRGYLNG